MSLISFWKLDETSGGVAANSVIDGGDLTSTITNAWNPNGKYSGSLLTNGALNDELSFKTPDADRSGLGAITISLWLKQDAGASSYQDIFCIGYRFSGIRVSINSTKEIKFECSTTGGNLNLQTALKLQSGPTWRHLVITHSPGQSITDSSIYIDGVRDGYAGAASSNTITYGEVDKAIVIGSNIEGNNGAVFYGCMDHVRIYDHAISAEDVATLYNESTVSPVVNDPLVESVIPDQDNLALILMCGDPIVDASTRPIVSSTTADTNDAGDINVDVGFTLKDSLKRILTIIDGRAVKALDSWKFKDKDDADKTSHTVDGTGRNTVDL